MRKNISVIVSIFQFWILIQCISYAATVQNPLRGYHGAPIIDPYDSVVISVNEGRIIECKGKEPITWVSEIIKNFPDAVEITFFEGNIKDDDSIIFTEDQNLFHSHLELKSVTISQVGFYYCVHNRSVRIDNDFDYEKEVIDYEASSIYVFVNDTENPLYNHNQNLIFARQYEPFIIPCKPNSPDVKIELIKDGEEVKKENFDIKIGFKLVENHTAENIILECYGYLNESCRFEKSMILSINPLSIYLKKPIIISDSQNYAKNGDNFTLTCNVEMTSDAAYLIKFNLPNGKEAQTSDYLTLSEIEHEHNNKRKSHRNLTIHKALDERDQGDYTCIIIDLFNNSNSAMSSITFVDKPVVQLNSSNPMIKTSKGKKTAKFHLNYFAYPKASFEWYDPHKNLIAKDNNIMTREKYNIAISPDDMTFTIKFPGIEDYGEYTLVAFTDGERFEKKVMLVVSEKPTCKMEDAYIMQGEEIHMKCECMAYPAAEIIWSFQPCQHPILWPKCRDVKNINTDELNEQNQNETQNTQDAETIQSSEIRFTASQPGTVKCRAENDIGEDEIQAKVQIVDLSAPLLLSGIDENQNIAIGDNVTLECGAIIYNYTDKIRWLKNEEPVEERNDLHIKDSSVRFSYRQSLSFDAILKEDEGEYKCEVYDKENNELHKVSIVLRIYENEPPMIITNFKQKNITEYSGNSLTLKCTTSGFPTPSLKWFKNRNLFEINENDTRISLKDNKMTLVVTELKLEDTGYYECIAENPFGKDTKAIEISIKLSDFPFDLNLVFVISGAVAFIILLLCIIILCLKHQCKGNKSSQTAGP
ncbi:hypothetical protein ACKWTF_002226 [Chironomus riparius]